MRVSDRKKAAQLVYGERTAVVVIGGYSESLNALGGVLKEVSVNACCLEGDLENFKVNVRVRSARLIGLCITDSGDACFGDLFELMVSIVLEIAQKFFDSLFVPEISRPCEFRFPCG